MAGFEQAPAATGFAAPAAPEQQWDPNAQAAPAAQPTPPPVVSATHVLWEYDGRPAVKTVPSALRRTLMHSSAR